MRFLPMLPRRLLRLPTREALVAVALASSGASRAQTLTVTLGKPARDFGVFVGDLLTSTAFIDIPPGAVLDPRSLPQDGPVSPIVDIRRVSVGGTPARLEIRRHISKLLFAGTGPRCRRPRLHDRLHRRWQALERDGARVRLHRIDVPARPPADARSRVAAPRLRAQAGQRARRRLGGSGRVRRHGRWRARLGPGPVHSPAAGHRSRWLPGSLRA